MGLCLSHCGQAQHKAAVVAVSISHHSPGRPSRTLSDVQHHDHCASHPGPLKKFLHLYKHDGGGSKYPSCEKFCARPSIDDSTGIPHSSELFSLPSEGSDSEGCDRSRSPSPARGSITSSVTRSSASSRLRSSSPRQRRPGRYFSPDKPRPIPSSRARKSYSTTPERKSCSSLGQVDPEPPAHTSLVDTIARLEKLCDAKLLLENRLLRNNSNSRAGATRGTGHGDDESTSILLHESCRDLAHKLLCFANEHADGILASQCHSASRETKALDDSEACVTPDSSCAAASLSQPKESTSLPVEKSVHCEAENCVLKGDAAAAPAHEEEAEAEEHDDEKLQFTAFEATFELLAAGPSEETSASEQPSDEVLGQDTRGHDSARASTSPQESSAPGLEFHEPAHRLSRTTSDSGGALRDVDIIHLQNCQRNQLLRSALTDISANVVATPAPVVRRKSLEVCQKAKRGGSRSLDLQNCSVSRQEFETLVMERWRSSQGVVIHNDENSAMA